MAFFRNKIANKIYSPSITHYNDNSPPPPPNPLKLDKNKNKNLKFPPWTLYVEN